jgi:hypothetical protein
MAAEIDRAPSARENKGANQPGGHAGCQPVQQNADYHAPMYLHKYRHRQTHRQRNRAPAARAESDSHADPVIDIKPPDTTDQIEKCGENKAKQDIVDGDSDQDAAPRMVAPCRGCATLKSVKQPAREEPAHHDGGDRRERSGHEDSHTSQLCFGGQAIFRARAWRFQFRALQPLRFQHAPNTIRGVLGLSLEEKIFRPRLTSGPSGLVNPPLPFILRASHLSHRIFDIDESFELDIHTFDRAGTVAAEIARAFECAAGLRFRFENFQDTSDFELDLALAEPARAVLVHFLTPTELKDAGDVANTVPFAILFARLRDRIATLRRLYGDGELDVDFRGLGHRAGKISNGSWSDLESRFASRRSSRTNQVHSIGGLVGFAEYEGDLAEFVPWLRAASWTGIGRHTVWGNGQIECEFRN